APVPAACLRGPFAGHRHPLRRGPGAPLGPCRSGCWDHLGLAVGEGPQRCEDADLTADAGLARDGGPSVARTPGTAAARAPERRAALARARPGVRINARHAARPLPRPAV